MDKQVVLLTDYTGYLWGNHIGTRISYELSTVSAERIKGLLEEKGHKTEILTFQEASQKEEWENIYVLYASSEKRGGFYKNHIEDILLYIKGAGGILVPDFQFFRAHENKNYAELLRKKFKNRKLRIPQTFVYGCYEELEQNCAGIQYPCVIKSASGSGSKGVRLAHDEKELNYYAKKISEQSYFNYEYTYFRRFFESGIGYYMKKMYHALRGIKANYKLDKDFSNKFIVQEYVEGLQGDYKVLFFATKFYALYRENRQDDFRASGSGKFRFPEMNEELRCVLNFAKECTEEIRMPMISMDIAVGRNGCWLIEYQCVDFGTYTLEFSEAYFKYSKESSDWVRIEEKPDLERELVSALCDYMR